jgi:DNA-binding response OmpR family regulator
VKILLAFERPEEARILSTALETLDGYSTSICSELTDGVNLLRNWRPELLIADERLRRDQPDSGLRLAETCRIMAEQTHRSNGPRALILLSRADWDRMKRARYTGASVVVKGSNFDAVLRYVQMVADDMKTDRSLGPILFGFHRVKGRFSSSACDSCSWDHAAVSYGSSETDIDLTPVRAAILNALFRLRRGQSAAEIIWTVHESIFLRSILNGRTLKETSVKMEISRLRDDIAEGLKRIGAPYRGCDLLPFVPRGIERYRLEGNWRLMHIPEDLTDYVG